MFIKKNKNVLKYFFVAIILIIIFIVFSWRSINFLVERKYVENLEDRILLIVIENNLNLPSEVIEEYEGNKNLVNIIFSYLFKVDKKNLENKSLIEIFDLYGEDYQASRFKKTAKNYRKVVILIDEEASYDNFKKVLLNLNNEGKVIDIILSLHGGPNVIGFYNQSIPKNYLVQDEDFALNERSLNIGYVYQTLCYGGEDLNIWLDLGAKVASGSRRINHYTAIASEKFLSSWIHGKNYYDAVNDGFDFEVLIWKIVGKVIPNKSFFSVNEKHLEDSEMIFAGEKGYRLR